MDDSLKSPAAALKSPTPGQQVNYVPSIPKSVQRKQELYSGGKPSKFDKAKLMKSEGIIPIQAGSNKYASQKGMTGFGVPRDVIDKVKSENLKEITDEAKIAALKSSTWLQSGTNKFASQKGQTGKGNFYRLNIGDERILNIIYLKIKNSLVSNFPEFFSQNWPFWNSMPRFLSFLAHFSFSWREPKNIFQIV